MTQATQTLLNGDWPYPRWIAHRGAGKLAPENTLTAFALGAQHGYRMFECDVKLSLDDVPFLLHDDTLSRTTNVIRTWNTDHNPVAGHFAWSKLSTLDAGSWHSEQFKDAKIPTLEQVAAFCTQNNCHINLEIKPTTGTDCHTGSVVAQYAARLWQYAATPPLLSSFKPEALRGAAAAHADLPRALLLDILWDGWLQTALELQCVAIVFHHSLISTETAQLVKKEGLRFLSYTVNDAETANRLMALGVDGIITDRVDFFKPDQ